MRSFHNLATAAERSSDDDEDEFCDAVRPEPLSSYAQTMPTAPRRRRTHTHTTDGSNTHLAHGVPGNAFWLRSCGRVGHARSLAFGMRQ